MRHTCRLLHILATCALLISSVTAFTQTPTLQTSTMPPAAASPNPPAPKKPTLIVWARTDIPNQGAPTLDLLDLERYFVNQLVGSNLETVVSSLATKIPRTPAPNMYLGEVSADVMQLAQRPVWNDSAKRTELDTLFGVDLTLTLKHFKTGRVLGVVRGRAENHFGPTWDERDIPKKRAAIYTAADILANRFVAEVNGGTFGAEVKSLLPLPPPPTSQSASNSLDPPSLAQFMDAWSWVWTGDHVWYALGGIVVVLLFSAALGKGAVSVACSRAEAKRLEEQRQVQEERRLAVEEQRKHDDKRLKDAIALAIATENFSEAACRDAVSAAVDDIIEKREAIEAGEAERILKSKERELEYARIAEYGATTSDYDSEVIVQILRRADEWDYRMLREAQFQYEWRSAS